MRRVSIKAAKSFSQTDNKRIVNVRVSNGRTAIARKAITKTK